MSQPSENKNSEHTPIDRSGLSKLYPTPKSFDELAHEREVINTLRARRMPRHIILVTSIRMYSVFIGFGLGLTVSFAVIPTNIIAGVFFSFLLGLMLLGYAVWMITRVFDSFQKCGYNASPFLQSYVLGYSILIAASYYVTCHVPLFVFLMLVTCLHFILVYVLLTMTMRSSQKQ